MAFDAFLKLEVSGSTPDNLKGEVVGKALVGAIEVVSFSFGAENTVNFGSMFSGGGAGKAQFKEFEIQKYVDSASPGLFLALCKGAHFSDAYLYLHRAGTTTATPANAFAQIHMKLVIVTNIEFSGASGNDRPLEQVRFKYGAVELTYRKQNAHGKAGADITAAWSQVKNMAGLEIE